MVDVTRDPPGMNREQVAIACFSGKRMGSAKVPHRSAAGFPHTPRTNQASTAPRLPARVQSKQAKLSARGFLQLLHTDEHPPLPPRGKYGPR